MVWPRDTADDRRLAAVIVAAGTGLILFLGCVVVGVAAKIAVVLVGVGFFGALGSGLALLFGPDDYDCDAELATVTGLVPEAKRVWDEQRAAARAARAARRAERASRKRAACAARRAERAARKRVSVGGTSTEELVELAPIGGPPPGPVVLNGDGAFAVPVLGEVHVGRILAAVCHDELPLVGQDKVVSAVVQIESTTRDSQAVSVEIGGRKVGHLSRADARALRRRVDRDGETFKCRAAIHAGWKGGRVHYDLRLDVDLGAHRPGGFVGRDRLIP
jgi:hypothetical protein